MAGELVPLVMLPRYTTYAGEDYEFRTIAMDVTQYQNAIVNVWRGPFVASAGSPEFQVTFEESTDQVTWSTCTGTTAATAVSEDSETQFTAQLKKRWFRMKVKLTGGTNPVATCWAVGFLEERTT